MYVRIYNEKLVTVYEEEDLENSGIIGKLKGREVVGFSIREKEKIIYHDVNKITAKESQLIIRNQKTVTIAISMTEDEVFEYFYLLLYNISLEEPSILEKEMLMDEMIEQKIDANIAKSDIYHTLKPKLLEKLREEKR